MSSRVIVSAQGICLINGFLFAEVQGINWSTSTPQIPRNGVDSLTSYALDPGVAECQGTLQVLRLAGSGGLEARGIVAPLSHISREKYFSILVLHRVTGETLYRADHCKVTNQTWNMQARGRMEGSFSFRGLESMTGVDYASAP